MKLKSYIKWALLISVVFCGISSLPGQRFDKEILLEGRKRVYIISRPTGSVPPEGYPVVVMLHGTSGDGELFYETSGWKELGQQEKFISVFPSSLAYCINEDNKNIITTKWNNGDLQSVACPGQVLRDDVLFMKRMVDTLKAGFPINTKRIYFCGFSNGGVQAAKLAAEMSDVIAASVCASGILHDLDSGEIKPQVPCWMTVGTMDDRFLTALNKFNIRSIPYNDSALFILNDFLENFTSGLGLQNQYTRKDSSANLTFYEFSKLKNGAAASSKFIFLLARNMFHVFPNGTNYPIFESAPLYWNLFFKNIIKSPTTPIQSQAIINQRLRVYPNPAQSEINVEFPLSTPLHVLNITDALGREIMQIRPTFSELKIPIFDFQSGIYLIQAGPFRGKFIKN